MPDDRSAYVYYLCREKALRGNGQLMMVRDVNFHGHALVEGGLQEMMRRARAQTPTSVLAELATRGAATVVKPGARGRRRR